MPLNISTTKHWHSRGMHYIPITSQFCDECTLGITSHTCKRVGELHHCVEAMLEYYDATLNLELCPWFTRCLIVKLLWHHPTPKSIKRLKGIKLWWVYGIGNKESHHFTTRPWRSIELTLKGRIFPRSMDGGFYEGTTFVEMPRHVITHKACQAHMCMVWLQSIWIW